MNRRTIPIIAVDSANNGALPAPTDILTDRSSGLIAPPPLALYVHWPWCVKKCPYCDFNSHAATGAVPEVAYLDAVRADLEATLPLVWGRRVVRVFIGGGAFPCFPEPGRLAWGEGGSGAGWDVAARPGWRVEGGNPIYARDVGGTRVNPAAKLLLFGHAFGRLDVGRVALRCDHRNLRSRQAIARLGGRFEGTLRRFRPAAVGSVAGEASCRVLRDGRL